MGRGRGTGVRAVPVVLPSFIEMWHGSRPFEALHYIYFFSQQTAQIASFIITWRTRIVKDKQVVGEGRGGVDFVRHGLRLTSFLLLFLLRQSGTLKFHYQFYRFRAARKATTLQILGLPSSLRRYYKQVFDFSSPTRLRSSFGTCHRRPHRPKTSSISSTLFVDKLCEH